METVGSRLARAAAAAVSLTVVTGCQAHQPRLAWLPMCLISCHATIEGDRINEPAQFPPAPPTPKKRR